MEFIEVNQMNIDKEHICCAISDKKGESCVSTKKAWLKERFKDGLVFLKSNERGKVFIEYISAEKAWCPVVAKNYMFINCFWVSGSYKGKGYSKILLEKCIEDAKAKGKVGLTILSSDKKRSFLSDPSHLKHCGFIECDSALPYFKLFYLPFNDDVIIPKFKACVKTGCVVEQDMVLYYTNQCPHTEKYVPIIQEIAKTHGKEIIVHKIETTIDAQNSPSPFTTYSFFYKGKFVANEIFSGKKFEKFLLENNL